ncbi:MAG: hypothetical protein A2475_02560 [Ignavibacteria bacterium RIFOXYC2_FULL_35_21]|nr:MAG: hypothetical protein A2475_02560 [Ignavibacteria bacterium RIFOXYC2_FULL_35_21]
MSCLGISVKDISSKIKNEYYEFEENLQSCSKNIYNSTGKGYLFNAYNILQLLNLIVKQGVRIDPKKVKSTEIQEFKTAWDKLEKPLLSFFSDYIFGQFKINNSSIVPRNLALLPIMVYFYEIYNKGFGFKNLSGDNLKKINQYFIKSQINDWSLQSYADNFTRIIKEKSSSSSGLFDFPLQEIESYISERKLRNIEIHEQSFVGYVWFTLKILTPERMYQFEPDMQGRFNPEIDHIFPNKLVGKTPEYDKAVNIIWNMQPTKGEINGYKTNIHPKEFFTDKAVNKKGDRIIGSKYISEYDFLFPTDKNGQIDFLNEIWEKPIDFINTRKMKMTEFLKNKYDIEFKKEGLNA